MNKLSVIQLDTKSSVQVNVEGLFLGGGGEKKIFLKIFIFWKYFSHLGGLPFR